MKGEEEACKLTGIKNGVGEILFCKVMMLSKETNTNTLSILLSRKSNKL